MTLAISVLPLRLTDPQQDVGGMIGTWMDNTPSMGLMSMNCHDDLLMLDRIRQHISTTLNTKDKYDDGVDVLNEIHNYYHYLLECEEKGFVGQTQYVSIEWESSLTGHIQKGRCLEYERANLIWNLVTLEAYQASKLLLDSKVGWNKAAQHLQNAASWLQHMPKLNNPPPDLSPTFVQFWQSLLVAQAQRCVYESIACTPRQRHVLLAKLAAAAVPLFSDVETIVEKDDDSPAPSLTHFSSLVASWSGFARAWGMYMSCKAEYHQSQLSRDKKEFGQEIARLDLAYQYAAICNDFCEQAPLVGLQNLHSVVVETLHDLKEKVDQSEQENAEEHNQPVPTRSDLTPIRGEKLVNIHQPLSKLLKPKTSEPIFQNVSKGPDIRFYVQSFQSEMDQSIRHIMHLTESRMEEGRKALARVNLPQSLTAYRQEQSGGGLPEDLWRKVELVQKEHRIAQLKQDLWELRDSAELARSTFQTIKSQLDFDLDSDRTFRQQYPDFEGHDAEEVQKSFRQSLAHYEDLLMTAQQGDVSLLKRLDQLDTNPKYKLLQFQKSQLDRLLPGAGGSNNNNNNSSTVVDTSRLSQLLVELSALFNERDELILSLQENFQNFDIVGFVESQVDPRTATCEDYEDAIMVGKKSFDGLFHDIQNNIDEQVHLVNTILLENDNFMHARERNINTQHGRNNIQSGDSCIVMIEDAIEEIDELSNHMTDGRGFYDAVIPKLQKLQHQVGDVSAKLAVERIEYEDKIHQPRPPNPDEIDFDGKVATLIGMGFEDSNAVDALKKHNGNLNEAIADLLSG
jgi:programmed cell death 6-interacting protein